MSDTSTTTIALLHELADLCLDACVSPEGPVAVGFAVEGCDDTDDVVLSLRELDGVGDLIGFDAPADWDVFGVAATSESTPIVHLQHRDGQAVTMLGQTEHTTYEGRVPDICRRVLGLATEPVPFTSTRFFAQSWLEQCVLFALEHDNPSWDDLRDLCTFAPLCHDTASDDSPSVDAVFRALGRVLANRFPWAILRRGFAAESRQSCISPDAAAWMDDAMFARELLAERLPVHALVDDIESMVRFGVVRHLRETLDAWGVERGVD